MTTRSAKHPAKTAARRPRAETPGDCVARVACPGTAGIPGKPACPVIPSERRICAALPGGCSSRQSKPNAQARRRSVNGFLACTLGFYRAASSERPARPRQKDLPHVLPAPRCHRLSALVHWITVCETRKFPGKPDVNRPEQTISQIDSRHPDDETPGSCSLRRRAGGAAVRALRDGTHPRLRARQREFFFKATRSPTAIAAACRPQSHPRPRLRVHHRARNSARRFPRPSSSSSIAASAATRCSIWKSGGRRTRSI